MFMDRDKVEVHKHTKKELGQYPAILSEQTWSTFNKPYNVCKITNKNNKIQKKPYNVILSKDVNFTEIYLCWVKPGKTL